MFGSRRPNVSRLARKGRTDDLIQTLRYSDWTALGNGEYVDVGTVVRREAVEALAAFDESRVGDAIARYSLQDSDIGVQLAAVRVLQARIEATVASAMARAFAVPGDRYEAVRVALGDALRTAPDLSAEPLARALIGREDGRPLDDREQWLLHELAGSGEDGAEVLVGEFVAGLAHERPAAQERSVDALVALAPHSIPSLIHAMIDQRCMGRAADALGRCRDGRAVEPLIGLLHNGDSTLRAHAARALGELRDPRSAEALLALAQDDDYEVRLAASSALDALGSIGMIVSVATMLRPLLHERGGRVHLDAADPTGAVRMTLEAPLDEQPSHDAPRELTAGPGPARSISIESGRITSVAADRWIRRWIRHAQPAGPSAASQPEAGELA